VLPQLPKEALENIHFAIGEALHNQRADAVPDRHGFFDFIESFFGNGDLSQAAVFLGPATFSKSEFIKAIDGTGSGMFGPSNTAA
jgi:hypothetical protein